MAVTGTVVAANAATVTGAVVVVGAGVLVVGRDAPVEAGTVEAGTVDAGTVEVTGAVVTCASVAGGAATGVVEEPAPQPTSVASSSTMAGRAVGKLLTAP